MTAVWGPLGWMTLHSISTSYPENPTVSEKQLMYTWLDMFRDTITCPYCRDHFAFMLASYRARYPNMLASRQDLAMFVFRAHNGVNARLQKPVYNTLEECMIILKNNIKLRSASDYRISYINHIMKFWGTNQDIAGIVAMKKVVEMKKIEIDYFSKMDTKFEVSLKDDGVVIPRAWLEAKREEEPRLMPAITSNTIPRAGFKIVGGRLRLR
jgi:hypothetical protein